MKPAPFAYERPGSLDEAVALLAEHGSDAVVLAGGQSLLIDLRYRRLAPAVVVDVNRIASLEGAGVVGGALRLGALARHRLMEDLRSRGVDDPLADLAARAAEHVAHPPVRTRGTVVGSLAWANPVAEWGALAVMTGARLHLASTRGERTVAAADWATGPFTTVRAPDELVTAVDLPLLGGRAGVGFAEHRRTSASYALVAALVAVELDDAGAVVSARIGVAGAGGTPLRAARAEEALLGRSPDARALAGAAREAASAADPVDEPHASADYRRHVVGVLVRRALTDAVASAPGAAAPAGGRAA